MFGIPQANRIAHDYLFRNLAPYGYRPTKNTPGLWTHNRRPINLTLVVNDFDVRFTVKEHALHLKVSLESKYKVRTYWYGKIYVSISLTWDFYKGTVKLAMPGYVRTSLHSFPQKNLK